MRKTLLTVAVMLAWIGNALAEIPKQSPKQLQKNASNIVVGKIQAVYTHQETEGNFAKTKGIVEIQIDTIEKGDGLEEGELLYARFWETHWLGKKEDTPTYGSGHYAIDKEIGSTVRAYVSSNKKDQGFDILLTNGLQEIEKTGTKEQWP